MTADKMRKSDMRRRKPFFICLILTIFLAVSACGTNQTKEGMTAENKSDIPKQYKKELNCLIFDIEHIQINVDDDFYQGYAKKIQLNPKIITRQFLGDFQEDIYVNENGIIYLEKEGKNLYIDRNSIVYLSNPEIQSYIAEKFSFEKSESDTASIHSYTEFTEASLQSEKKQLERMIQKIGIPNLVLKKCYDIEKCRYWLGIQEWQKTPVFTTVLYEGMNDERMPVQILNTSKGVEKLNASYYFEFEQKKEKIKLLSFDKIAEALENEYSMILTDNKYNVIGAELYFWVDVNQEESEYKMEPVWIFTIREYHGGKEKNGMVLQEIIHAETGKRVGVRG